MREILFRGKRLDNGKWVEGYYTCTGGRYNYILSGKICIGNDSLGFEHYLVEKSTVGQFTGLWDKNNVRIFEGDIVKFGYGYGFDFGVANYYNGCFCVKHGICNTAIDIVGEKEVIGNIYDNPELLKEEGN